MESSNVETSAEGVAYSNEVVKDTSSVKLCHEVAIRCAINDLNFALERCVAVQRSTGTDVMFPKTCDIALANLKLSNENSRNFLLNILFDELYVHIAKRHGLSATATTITIDVKNFCTFESKEFHHMIEKYPQKGGQFMIPPPVNFNLQPLTVTEKVTMHMNRAEQRVISLGETILQLEKEIIMRKESERIREEALRTQLDIDANRGKSLHDILFY